MQYFFYVFKESTWAFYGNEKASDGENIGKLLDTTLVQVGTELFENKDESNQTNNDENSLDDTEYKSLKPSSYSPDDEDLKPASYSPDENSEQVNQTKNINKINQKI